jgi:hypothetical protein
MPKMKRSLLCSCWLKSSDLMGIFFSQNVFLFTNSGSSNSSSNNCARHVDRQTDRHTHTHTHTHTQPQTSRHSWPGTELAWLCSVGMLLPPEPPQPSEQLGHRLCDPPIQFLSGQFLWTMRHDRVWALVSRTSVSQSQAFDIMTWNSSLRKRRGRCWKENMTPEPQNRGPEDKHYFTIRQGITHWPVTTALPALSIDTHTLKPNQRTGYGWPFNREEGAPWDPLSTCFDL